MKPRFSLKYGDRSISSDEMAYVTLSENTVFTIADGIIATVELKKHTKFNASEWVIYFENTTDQNSEILSEIWDCDTILELPMPERLRPGYMPKRGNVCINAMNGLVSGEYYWGDDRMSATEFAIMPRYLGNGHTAKYQNVEGRSSSGTMPFFDVTSMGCGAILAVGWSGSWKTEFTRCDSGVRIKSGLGRAAFYLKPHEKVRTTSVLIMQYGEGEDKFNKFRKLIKNEFSYKAKRDSLLAFELWGGLPSHEMVRRLQEIKDHGMLFEDLWIDAAWYGTCQKCEDGFSGDWASHTGEWTINPRVHPDDFLEVKKAAQDAGMNMMLWFEPERAFEGVPILKEHPEFFTHLTGENAAYPHYLIDYSAEGTVDYVFDLISQYVEKLELSCYRQDFNVPLSLYVATGEEPGRAGIKEILHVTGLYRLWDKLHERFPELLIDNCASGGRRIDIETLKRSIPFFRSDYQCNFNENSDVLQTHNAGISLYLPQNGCTTKTKRDDYATRSSYSSSWGGAFYNAIFQSMTEEDFAWAKKTVDEYRRIRRYFTESFYNHGSAVLDDSAWAIWQYHDEETQSGILMAFRRDNSPFATVDIDLFGMKEGAVYSYENLNDGSICEGGTRLTVNLPEKHSSVIFEYKLK